MMNDPSHPGYTGSGEDAVKAEPNINLDEIDIKEELRNNPPDYEAPACGIDGEDLTKTDYVKVKDEPIDVDESKFIPDETIVKMEDTSLETHVIIKCETQDYLKDETADYAFPEFDPEDEAAHQDFLNISGCPSDQGQISTGAGRFSCHHCGSAYHKKSLLAGHVMTHLQHKNGESLAVKKILCPHCDHRCFNLSNLKLHLLTHIDLSLQCPHCDYTTKNQMNLKLHLTKHAGIEYKCRFCPYKTTSKTYMTTHFSQYHRKPEKCHFCSFSGPYRKVSVHEYFHHPGEQYSCDQCPMKFPRRSHLKRHISAEHNLLYKCYNCEYKTPLRKNLSRHVLIHINPTIRMYKCRLCTATFPTCEERLVHAQSNHSKARKKSPRRKPLLKFFRMDQL